MLALWEERYDKFRQHIKKQRNHFADKDPYSQSYGFSSSHCILCTVAIVHKSQTIKKAAQWRIGAFELWCWRRLLRVPWSARGSSQSVLEEINSEFSFEGLMLKLKLQCFDYLMRRANSLKHTLVLGKIEGKRRRGWQRIRWLDSITNLVDMNLSKLEETLEGRGGWHTAVHRVTKSQTWLELTHWKRPWCWEGLGTGGEGDDRAWDGWMASLTQWAWVWVNSGSWWWTGRPGVLQFMGSQRVGHDWATELNWTTVLRLNVKKARIMASGLITAWQIEGEKAEVVTDSLFLGSTITLDGDWSHGIRGQLLLGSKAIANLGSVLRSRDITLPIKFI